MASKVEARNGEAFSWTRISLEGNIALYSNKLIHQLSVLQICDIFALVL